MEENLGETFETFQRKMRSIDFFRKNSHNFKFEIEPEQKIYGLMLAFRSATMVLKHFYESKGFKIKEINTVWSLGIKDGYIEEENVWKSMYFNGKEFNSDYDYKTDPELFNTIHDRLFLLLQNFEEKFKNESNK